MDTQVKGRGELLVESERGPCAYRLTFWADDPLRGDGWLNDGEELLTTAAKVGRAELTLADGRRVITQVLGVVDGVARVSFEPT